jgi:membrane-bound serine protease (ClpP class)
MEPLEMAAHQLFDPTTAYLLFVLGLFAVFVEVSHPGALVPGLMGLVSLILAVAAFAVLPVNLLAVALILLAVALMAVDARAIGHGGPTLMGIGCLVIGSLLLYAQWGGGSPLLPELAIAPPVLVVVTVAGLLLGFGLIRAAGSVRRLPPLSGTGQLIGAWGVSNGPLEPDGVVRVNGQLWSARLRGGQLGPDQPVRVRARRGLILDVEPATSRGAATEKGASR